MLSTDDIGDRGQWLLALLMTQLCGRDVPYFRPRFLGDKYPTFDFIVELVDHPQYYFFVQVKTTTKGYTKKPPHRLLVKVTQNDIDRMVACPAPSYVVGIDDPGQIGFLLSINESRSQMTNMTTQFPIDCKLLKKLATEVRNYWTSRNMILKDSQFKE